MTSSGVRLSRPTRAPIADEGGSDDSATPRRWLSLRVAGAVIIVIWLAGLVAFSTLLYHRDYLTEDFGAYNQAWSLIGQGHLNPFETIFQGYPFYKSDLELIIWPLALIHLVFPQPIVLLWLQDLAIAGTGLVVFLWIVDFLRLHRIAWWPAAGISLVALAAWIANPGVYQTVGFDFHIEPVSTFFLVMAGRTIWLGRHRRAWIWIALTLLCGTFSAVAMVGLGISAILAGGRARRQGMFVVVAAVAWLGFIAAIGANTGSGLDSYAYLAGRASLPAGTGIGVVVIGMLTHPWRVFDQIHSRLHYLYTLVKPVGVIGVATAWGFGVPVVVMFVNSLNANYEFTFQAYQNFAVFPFTLLGTVMVLVWLAKRFQYGWIPSVVVALAVIVQAGVYGYTTSPGNIRYFESQIGAGPGAQLRKALALTPPGAEVIATIGIMGRFSARPYVYWFDPNSPMPVHARQVVFVFDPAIEHEIAEAQATDDIQAASFVQDHLHARVLVDADGVSAFQWQAPAGTTTITLPTHRQGS